MPPDHVIDVPVAPEDLPPVRPSDLVHAWNAATVAAEIGLDADPENTPGIRFRRPDGEETRVVFADVDANFWVAAMNRAIGLDTLHGLSVCFRLLGLIDLMARMPWMRPHFVLGGEEGPDIHPALLRVAATMPLNIEAKFDPAGFQSRAETMLGPRRLGRRGL